MQNYPQYAYCPKLSTTPITISPIWKWEFANGAVSHYAYGALQQEKNIKFHLHMKDYKWGRKWMFIYWESCNGDPLQIPIW